MTSAVFALTVLAVVALGVQLVHHAVMTVKGVYGPGFPGRDLDLEAAESLQQERGLLARVKGLTARRAEALLAAEGYDTASADETTGRTALVEEFAESSRLVSESMGELVAGVRSNHGARVKPLKGAVVALRVLLMVLLIAGLVFSGSATT